MHGGGMAADRLLAMLTKGKKKKTLFGAPEKTRIRYYLSTKSRLLRCDPRGCGGGTSESDMIDTRCETSAV